MKNKALLLLISSFFLFTQSIIAQVNEQDSLILIDFMKNTGIQYWNTDKQVFHWAGIHITGNRVTDIIIKQHLSGSLPSSIGNLSALTELSLMNANFSGGIPGSIKNLTALTKLELISDNFSGEIPDSIGKLISLNKLNLGANNLTGNIPPSIGNMSALINLNFAMNNLSGRIPPEIGNLSNLRTINLNENNLTDSIPSEIGNISGIEAIWFNENDLTGKIPLEIGNLGNLINFEAHHNNLSGEIPKELFKCKKLVVLILGANNLTDSIPSEIGNLTLLESLDLSGNNLKGEVPSEIEKLVNLHYLKLNGNQLEVCTKLPKSINNTLYLQDNRFNFDDLMPFANQPISDFKYAPQKDINLKKRMVNETFELSMDAGGTQTTYQWFYDNVKISGATEKEYIVSTGKEVQKYHCEAKNSLLPDLTLIGKYKKKEQKNCWQAGQLTFCLSSGEWGKVSGSNKIKSTNIISINDFLFFDGTMTIDTTKLELEASGEFYFDNIPLAKDLAYGKYTLAEGKFKLNLIGDEQKITNFLNSELSKTAMIFGTPVKIDDLHFFNRNDTIGVNINASVSVPLLSSGCGIPGIYNPKTDLKLKNFEITNKGILSAGFEIGNLGLFSQGCLKNATLEYNWKKDILIGGAELSLSLFGDIGAGIKVEDGKIDSIAWKIDPSQPLFPIYGTFSAKGFYGHIAGLNNFDENNQFNSNNFDVKIGGIFSDLILKQAYQLKIDGRIKMSGLLEGSGEMQFFQPPVPNFPYQIKGFGKVALDYSNKQMDCDFTGNFGTLDGENWIGDTKGNFSFNMRNEIPELSAYFDGDFTFPKISDRWPLSLISGIIIGTTNRIFNDNPNLVYGKMYYYFTADDLMQIPYIIDITKNWYQWGYIRFPSVSKNNIEIIDEKSSLITNNVTKTFTVPENNEFAVVEIKSNENAPSSLITSPSGKEYTTSSPEDNIFYSESENKKYAFWSLLEATHGDWAITLENPADTDSLFTNFKLKDKEFKFTMSQTGKTVSVNWDVAQVEEGQTVNIMLDNDDVNFDGFRVTKGDATTGSLSFVLDESTPDCNYYLFVQLIDEYSIKQSYADDILTNPIASLAPPQNFNSQYNTETGELEFNWNVSASSDIVGYILTITDDLGKDSVYAILNSYQNNIPLFIEDFETKSAKIESYNQNWEIGCPSVLTELTTGIEKGYQIIEDMNNLKVYPNPTNGNLTIRYYVPELSKCEIRILNIQGKEIAQPLSGFQPAGFHQFYFKYEHLPNGIYLIKYICNNQSVTVKSVLSK